MNQIHISKNDNFNDIYNKYFRNVSSDEIYVGNGLNGHYTLKDLMDAINKNDLVKTLVNTQAHWGGEGLYHKELDRIINKLKICKLFGKYTVLYFLFEYNQMIEDSEDYIAFDKEQWDKLDSRLYPWFAIKQ